MAAASDQQMEDMPWYASLLGLAEHFRSSPQPNYRSCIHCLQSILLFRPPPPILSRTHLQLGNIFYRHTKNLDKAMQHLEQAWTIAGEIKLNDVKFEAVSLLVQIYGQEGHYDRAKPLLEKALETSPQQSPYWHCRMLFQLAEVHTKEQDYASAVSLLGTGSTYAKSAGSQYSSCLFLLSKAMILSIQKENEAVKEVLLRAEEDIEKLEGSTTQAESLRVFYLVLETAHFLSSGQTKTCKSSLANLQQCLKNYMAVPVEQDSQNSLEHFQWIPKEQMYILVYLVMVMHSVQSGYMEKARKYCDESLMRIEKLKILDSSPLLWTFQLMLLEHLIMCRLVMGRKAHAIHEIAQACQVCVQQPRLLNTHRPQLHILLGLYAMAMNCMDAAEGQFKTALQLTSDHEQVTFINLNLGIIYLRAHREDDFQQLIAINDPENMATSSHSMKASANYVRGLQCFFHAKYHEAKRYLRETLKMSNQEDLNRLTSMTLVLLGHIFLSLGNSRESMNMVTPAMQLASKIPDLHIQLWASALLKDLYRMCSDPVKAQEGAQLHSNFTSVLLDDHFSASQMAEHGMIQWTDGPLPDVNLPSTSTGAATNDANLM